MQALADSNQRNLGHYQKVSTWRILSAQIYHRSTRKTTVTPEERQRMGVLIEQIAVEKDHDKFTELVAELNALLDAKEQRLDKGGDIGIPKPS
jgi:hypothetical protein